MEIGHELLLNDRNYKVLYCENEYIIHPVAFGIIPTAGMTLSASDFVCTFHIIGYQLMLIQISLSYEGLCPTNQPMHYTGAIVIADEFVKEYNLKDTEQLPCFCYKSILELVFEDGVLVTTIDHSKDMLRIRKNIELGLRSLNNKRDLKCIQHFIKSSFVGDYDLFSSSKKRTKYLNKMKKLYNRK